MRYVVICICLGCAFMFGACTQENTSSSASIVSEANTQPSVSVQSEESFSTETMIYRGEITELSEENITVSQLPGYDYGQEEIVFTWRQEQNETQPELGMYVQVAYDGALTRSIPPQATALEVSVLAPLSEGALWGGEIISSEPTEEGYRIEMQAESPREELVIVHVPLEALEQLDETDLVEGAKVLAVTNGAMTASLPPQISAWALLPWEA